jgi:hypothetical protein
MWSAYVRILFAGICPVVSLSTSSTIDKNIRVPTLAYDQSKGPNFQKALIANLSDPKPKLTKLPKFS